MTICYNLKTYDCYMFIMLSWIFVILLLEQKGTMEIVFVVVSVHRYWRSLSYDDFCVWEDQKYENG